MPKKEIQVKDNTHDWQQELGTQDGWRKGGTSGNQWNGWDRQEMKDQNMTSD